MQSTIQSERKNGIKKMTTLLLTNLISWSPLRRGLLFIPLVCICFAFSPAPKAFGVSPKPDGGYPGGNTAEGENALFSNTTGGAGNTAIGAEALFSNTTGNNETATGFAALDHNTVGLYNTAYG